LISLSNVLSSFVLFISAIILRKSKVLSVKNNGAFYLYSIFGMFFDTMHLKVYLLKLNRYFHQYHRFDLG